MIEVRRLSRMFGSLTAVTDLSFEVRPGEIVGLLGPNGAGKTTTLRMLAALIPPTSGEAVICGHRLGVENPSIRRSVGLLTETPGLYDRLSAQRNLEFHARLHGVADAAARIERYLRLLDVWERRDDPAAALSKGMRQKLALARALLHEPQALLLDEPTAGLDPRMAKQVRELVQRLAAEGRAILVSTHNLAEAEHLCDRVALLKTRLVAFERPAALRRRLAGRRTIVRLARADDRATAVARALPFATTVSTEGDRLLVSMDDPDARNPALVRALVEAGAEIRGVSVDERSLEDVYLELMPDGAAP